MNGEYSMSEENKAIVRRAFEKLWNTGNVAVADEFIATNYVVQIPSGSLPHLGGTSSFHQNLTNF
jgi:hypothetical protein